MFEPLFEGCILPVKVPAKFAGDSLRVYPHLSLHAHGDGDGRGHAHDGGAAL